MSFLTGTVVGLELHSCHKHGKTSLKLSNTKIILEYKHEWRDNHKGKPAYPKPGGANVADEYLDRLLLQLIHRSFLWVLKAPS